MKRFGSLIRIKQEEIEKYKKLHSKVWPEVLKMIKECNIRNYSIYYRDGWLFRYFEYTGNCFEEDMKKMALDPVSKKWQRMCDHMQIPIINKKDDEWWAFMEEVFHYD